MSIVQKIVTTLVPQSWAASMERESREWKIICPECSHVRSVWDAGGIRWKAASVGKRVIGHCTACGGNHWMKLERRKEDEVAGLSAGLQGEVK